MLTKDSKKVLDFMNSAIPNLGYPYFEINYIATELKYDSMRVLAICETLQKDDYIAFADIHKTVVKTLEKGRNYKNLNHQEFMQFLNRSVVIPFFVSLATSIATMFIANLFN